jgi:hypothetical protein
MDAAVAPLLAAVEGVSTAAWLLTAAVAATSSTAATAASAARLLRRTVAIDFLNL